MALVSLQGTLTKILKKHHIRGLEEVRIFSGWSQIVGEQMANHARPVRSTDKILYVEVDDPIWLSQLKYMKQDIADKIDATIKEGLYKDIRFFLRNAS